MNRTKGTSFLSLCLLALGIVFLAVSCATDRGYVTHVTCGVCVGTSESDAYLSIGSKDGAVIGQELNVYKVVQTSTSPKTPIYGRQFKGKVKITEIIDEHFSKAQLVSGTVEQNDIVELVRPAKP